MRPSLARRPPAWALAVFALALAARLLFWWLADQPLLYTHQYHYFMNGLVIAQHPDPWTFLLRSDDWRLWDGHWTIAPLYYPFEALVFWIFGPSLEPLRLVQCVLGALTAVAVGAIGRYTAGPRGVWAGLLYAVHGYSVELPAWTLTENLHNVLFCVAMALLLKGTTQPGLGATAWGAALLGLSALARSVSSAFIPVAAVWRWFYAERERRWRAAAVVLACGLGVILPWTARNVFIIGDLVPIETTAYENIWYANHFSDRDALGAPGRSSIHSQESPAAKRQIAMHFALRGIRRNPGMFVDKVQANFWHFLRPEGLHHLLTAESSMEPWRHVFYILLDDLPGLLLLPPFLAFCAGGRRTAAWALIVLWTAYYVFFEVVVFLNEVPRHRTGFVPFFLAGGVAGLLMLWQREERRRVAPWIGFAVGAAIVVGLLQPYPVRGLANGCRAAGDGRRPTQAVDARRRAGRRVAGRRRRREGSGLAAAVERVRAASRRFRPSRRGGRRVRSRAGRGAPELEPFGRASTDAARGGTCCGGRRGAAVAARLLLERGSLDRAGRGLARAAAAAHRRDPPGRRRLRRRPRILPPARPRSRADAAPARMDAVPALQRGRSRPKAGIGGRGIAPGCASCRRRPRPPTTSRSRWARRFRRRSRRRR